MGGCHSKNIEIENQKVNNQCLICMNKISLQTVVYLKCCRCQILLHNSCSKKCICKSNTNSNTKKSNVLYCPNCKNRNSLISYNNHLINYKK
jgi:Zn finger protein HypA/HybF involved in hydrogenase expression